MRKQGTCSNCGNPLYGDDYGPAGHKCPNQEHITGWVAWHPVIGDLGVQSREVDALDLAQTYIFNALPMAVRTSVLDQDYIEIRKFMRGLDINAHGWKIRPVRIEFTYEGGGMNEPITQEALRKDLRDYLRSHELSQRKLSESCGISFATISRFMRNSTLSAKLAEKLYCFLHDLPTRNIRPISVKRIRCDNKEFLITIERIDT